LAIRAATPGSCPVNLFRHLRSGSKPPLKTFHHPSGDLHMILILESIKPASISLFSAAGMNLHLAAMSVVARANNGED